MFQNLPEHVAIIMDGNGRWATRKGLQRKDGHKEGSYAIDRLLETSLELGLKNISLYAFSTENWKRPISEVNAIFELLDFFIEDRLDTIQKNGIRVLHSGAKSKIPFSSVNKIQKAVDRTANNSKLNLNFCLNYGGQEEILHAFGKIIEQRNKSSIPLDREVAVEEFEKYLYTHPLPNVDLLIRTAGEQRVSNFLLWQIAYAEIYFTNTLWPDFNKEALFSALEWYEKRVRKFGGL